MDVQPVQDHGQKMPSPAGRVVGFFPTQAECEEATRALWAAGVAEAKIVVLAGEEGIHLLEGSQDDFFMGDGETELIQRGIVELRNGHCVLGVEAQDRDEAARIASIGSQHGGHGFSYFGTFVSEQLTK